MKNKRETDPRQEINQQKACISGLSINFFCFLVVKLPKVKRRILNALIRCIARGWNNPSQEYIARLAFTDRETVNRFMKKAQDIIGLLFMDSGKYTYNTNIYYLASEFDSPLVKEQLQDYLPSLMTGYTISSCQSFITKKVTPYINRIVYRDDNWSEIDSNWINKPGLAPCGELSPMKPPIDISPQRESYSQFLQSQALSDIDAISPEFPSNCSF